MVLHVHSMSRSDLATRKETREKAWQKDGWAETVSKVTYNTLFNELTDIDDETRPHNSPSLWIRSYSHRFHTVLSSNRCFRCDNCKFDIRFRSSSLHATFRTNVVRLFFGDSAIGILM